MTETSKRIKRMIREYAAAAHKEELRRALLPLADAFKRWEREELDRFALQDLIHQFHQGAARAGRRGHSAKYCRLTGVGRSWPKHEPA